MAVKFYAVKVGKTPGIYSTWEDCKAQVEGFPGATYKSFKTANEAAAYLGWNGAENVASMKNKEVSETKGTREIKENALSTKQPSDGTAYVDGSYNVATGEFSYGVVMFHNGKELHFSEKFDDEELATMRNVAGEIKGAEAAMSYAYEHDMKEINIYHDYEGIAKWPLRQWQANKEGTIAYRAFYDKISEKVHINFVKVKGHSGDKYNDEADRLAKEALGI